MQTLVTAAVVERARSRGEQDQEPDPLVRSERVTVRLPGYPMRTFVLRDLEDAGALEPGLDGDQSSGWLSSCKARLAGARLGLIDLWTRVRRNGILSLCSCLTVLLLGQVGAVSLMALQASSVGVDSGAAISRSNAPDPSMAHQRQSALLKRALSSAVAGIPTDSSNTTPAATNPTSPGDSSDPISSDLGVNYNTIGQPCHGSTFFVATITQWTVPPGCFAKIYSPRPASYPAVSGAFGYCNWWPEALHPTHTDLLTNANYRHGSTPVPGAAVHFAPGVQGASSDGHYAQVVAIQPGSPWILVTEMNFTWRGGGFEKVDYRYIKVGAGMTFIYDS